MSNVESQAVVIEPPVPEDAKYFLISGGSWIEKIYFDAATAFDQEAQYVEVFNAEGDPVVAYEWFNKGGLHDHPDFEGYACS